MVPGVTGAHGQAAPRLVEQEQEAEPEHVTIQPQLRGEQIVRDQVMSQKSVTRTPATQV